MPSPLDRVQPACAAARAWLCALGSVALLACTPEVPAPSVQYSDRPSPGQVPVYRLAVHPRENLGKALPLRVREGPGREHGRDEATTAASTISPPMVGVPAFLKWVCGPSARIGWPLPCRMRSDVMMRGPKKNTNSAEVNKAAPARKVM